MMQNAVPWVGALAPSGAEYGSVSWKLYVPSRVPLPTVDAGTGDDVADSRP